MANITNLPVTSQIKTGGEKVIALNQQNIDLLKKGYLNDPKVIAVSNAVSNKDLLSQSFSAPTIENNVEAPQMETAPVSLETNTSPIETTPIAVDVAPVENPIQISAIPTVQNNISLESDPVNMNMVAEEKKVEDAPFDPLSGLENLIPNPNDLAAPVEQVVVEPEVGEAKEEPTPTLPTIEPTVEEPKAEVSLDSPFQVSNGVNIFDQVPSPEIVLPEIVVPEIAVPEIEVPTEPVGLNEENAKNESPLNIFTTPQAPTAVEVNENPPVENNGVKTEISNDILQVEIALEKESADLYEKLAQNSRKKVELLEQKIKTTHNVVELNPNNEQSASELFNSNGTLNDNKVLEQSEGNSLRLVA